LLFFFKSTNSDQSSFHTGKEPGISTNNWGEPGNCNNFDSLKKKERPQSEVCAWARNLGVKGAATPPPGGQIFPLKNVFFQKIGVYLFYLSRFSREICNFYQGCTQEGSCPSDKQIF